MDIPTGDKQCARSGAKPDFVKHTVAPIQAWKMTTTKTAELTLYRLVNPSDPYTFYAPSIQIAGVCAVMLSTAFGAHAVGNDDESTPIMFGWNEWLQDHGINDDWIQSHANEIADAYDSFMIGEPAAREDVESMLAMLPDEKRDEWRNKRHERHLSSMNDIGGLAYSFAKRLRANNESN